MTDSETEHFGKIVRSIVFGFFIGIFFGLAISLTLPDIGISKLSLFFASWSGFIVISSLYGVITNRRTK